MPLLIMLNKQIGLPSQQLACIVSRWLCFWQLAHLWQLDMAMSWEYGLTADLRFAMIFTNQVNEL